MLKAKWSKIQISIICLLAARLVHMLNFRTNGNRPSSSSNTQKYFFYSSQYVKVWKLERDPYLLETSCPGIFAAGDVRAGAMNRVASFLGEGSMAISFVHKYLAEM